MRELKVGERVTLEVIEQNVCNGCDDWFFGYDDIYYNQNYNGCGNGLKCEPKERSDGKNVIFKEVK